MNADLTFHRSGTGDAGSRASRAPSLLFSAINPFRQPAIPDEGRRCQQLLYATLSDHSYSNSYSGRLGQLLYSRNPTFG